MPTYTHIAFFSVRDWEATHIKNSILSQAEIKLCEDTLSIDNAADYAEAEVISVFINSNLTADVLRNFPKLKLIATRSTGYDHIDMEYCKVNDIAVANVPVYGARTVAEHAMMLILALAKRLPESADRVKVGNFSPDGLTGIDIDGKTLGVIGTGNIGQNLIRYAKGFGMKVVAHDLYPNDDAAKEVGYEYVELEDLLKQSHVVSLHLPLTAETKHIINKLNIALTKRGVIIINTSRGGLIQTDALFDGLKSGQVGGAGLDVLEEEGFLKEELELLFSDQHEGIDFKVALENHMMAHLPNVIITPHNAFNTHEALERIILKTIDNITGKDPCFI